MSQKMCRICSIILASVLFALCFSCSSSLSEEKAPVEKKRSSGNSDKWTLMLYFGGDNSLDGNLVENAGQLAKGFAGGMNVVLLVDRIGRATSAEGFGEVFTGSRMYTLNESGYVRLYGSSVFPELSMSQGEVELNTGDAETLKKFIRYCKSEYPAEHYGLIIGSHGGGVRTGNQNARAVVQDSYSDNDWLFLSEITDVLSAEESVDVLGFDACCMGNLETAYQLCGVRGFHADFIVASPAEEWNKGWDYQRIAAIFARKTPEPQELAEAIVSEYRNYIEENRRISSASTQTLTCIKASAVPAVKKSLDELSRLLVDFRAETESLRGSGKLSQNSVLHYFNSGSSLNWLKFAYFDLYFLAEQISAGGNFPLNVRESAAKLAKAVDQAVICSYAGYGYTRAREGATGLSVFFPNGKGRYGDADRTYWDYQYWYNAKPLAGTKFSTCYGSIACCADGATESNGKVENWFELLDYWFDSSNINAYRP